MNQTNYKKVGNFLLVLLLSLATTTEARYKNTPAQNEPLTESVVEENLENTNPEELATAKSCCSSSCGGRVGPRGPRGLKGNTGAKGATGATGAKGDTGPAGATGATGQTGAQGNTGPAGAQGNTGPAGATGANGTNGTNGTLSSGYVTAYSTATQTFTAGAAAANVQFDVAVPAAGFGGVTYNATTDLFTLANVGTYLVSYSLSLTPAPTAVFTASTLVNGAAYPAGGLVAAAAVGADPIIMSNSFTVTTSAANTTIAIQGASATADTVIAAGNAATASVVRIA